MDAALSTNQQRPFKMEKTAGIVIIGNEILSGMVRDTNAAFMSRELKRHGVTVRRIATVPDDVDEIAHVVEAFSKRFDVVFTSGGLGSTPDDVTIAAIARAFNLKTVVDDHLKSLLNDRFQGRLSPEKLKMAQIPAGACLLTDESLRFPLIKCRNVFIYPGVPRFLRSKFRFTMTLIKQQPAFFARIVIEDREPEVAALLNVLARDNREVQIGSYPVEIRHQYRLLLTMESRSKPSLDLALTSFNDSYRKEKEILTG